MMPPSSRDRRLRGLTRLAAGLGLSALAACAPVEMTLTLSAEDLAKAGRGAARPLPATLSAEIGGAALLAFAGPVSEHLSVDRLEIRDAGPGIGRALAQALAGTAAAPGEDGEALLPLAAVEPEGRYAVSVSTAIPLVPGGAADPALSAAVFGLALSPEPDPPVWAAGATHRLDLVAGGEADAFRAALEAAFLSASESEEAAAEVEGRAPLEMAPATLPGRLGHLEIVVGGGAPVTLALAAATVDGERHWAWQGDIAPGHSAATDLDDAGGYGLP